MTTLFSKEDRKASSNRESFHRLGMQWQRRFYVLYYAIGLTIAFYILTHTAQQPVLEWFRESLYSAWPITRWAAILFVTSIAFVCA